MQHNIFAKVCNRKKITGIFLILAIIVCNLLLNNSTSQPEIQRIDRLQPVILNKNIITDASYLQNYQFPTSEQLFPKSLRQFKSKLLVLVISKRDNFGQRQIIRETYARYHTDVYFMIGNRSCPWPVSMLENSYTCQLSSKFSNLDEKFGTSEMNYFHLDLTKPYSKYEKIKFRLENNQSINSLHLFNQWFKNINLILSHQIEQESLSQKLKQEPNVITLPMIDSYDKLTEKMKLSYRWVHENLIKTNSNTPEWIVKIDDDSIVDIEQLESYLIQNYPSDLYPNLYLGKLIDDEKVITTGKDVVKWGEFKYSQKLYPTFANGATGYVVSLNLAKFLSVNSQYLENYHNEDAALGIWLYGSKLYENITYVNLQENQEFINPEGYKFCFMKKHGRLGAWWAKIFYSEY